jgi:hypothetical protein
MGIAMTGFRRGCSGTHAQASRSDVIRSLNDGIEPCHDPVEDEAQSLPEPPLCCQPFGHMIQLLHFPYIGHPDPYVLDSFHCP